jgi:5-methylcytosine-specific restriction endonuclease McrA
VEEIVHQGRRQKDSFVPVLFWDHLSDRMEKAAGIPKTAVETSYKKILEHQALQDPEKAGSAAWGVLPPEELVQRPEPDAGIDTSDVPADKAVEDADKSVVATLEHLRVIEKHAQSVIELIERPQVHTHPRVQEALADNRARMQAIWDRLDHYGVYLPDAMLRYMEDQEAQTKNLVAKSMPHRLDLWKQRHGMKERAPCEVCGKEIHVDDYERAHIVPSKRGRCGSNGAHNLLIACRECNQTMGDMDALVYRDITVQN